MSQVPLRTLRFQSVQDRPLARERAGLPRASEGHRRDLRGRRGSASPRRGRSCDAQGQRAVGLGRRPRRRVELLRRRKQVRPQLTKVINLNKLFN